MQVIAEHLSQLGESVSAFYTSNVEFYLFRSRTFAAFMRNVGALPVNNRSVIIRSVFRNPYGGGHPQRVAGYYSTQLLQSIEQLIEVYREGAIPSYWELLGYYLPQ